MNFKKMIFTFSLIAVITSALFFSSCNTGNDSVSTTAALTDALLTDEEISGTESDAAAETVTDITTEAENATLPLEGDSESVSDTVAEAASTTKPEEETTMSEEDMIKAEYDEFFSTIPYPSYELTDDDEPVFIGRWFTKEINGTMHHVTVTDGSTFHFLIEGAASFDLNYTVITLRKTPYFSYSIDGKSPIRQLITNPTVKLPDQGRHTVCIYADGLTEGEGKWQDERGFAFKDVTVPDGGSIKGIRPKNKVIAFYGDSITEGIRALGMTADSDGNSATNSYPYHCSAELGAMPYWVGYGASGLTRLGSFNTFINAIDYMSANVAVPDDFKPDLIVVNHGTNDGSASVTDFRNALDDALVRLTKKYPDTPVIYAIPFRQTQADSIRRVCKRFKNVTVIETSSWEISYTDGVHPNAQGAQEAGHLLAEAIKNALGEEFFKVD